MRSKKKHDDLGKQVWVTSGKMEHVAYLVQPQEEEVRPGKVLIQWQDGGRVYVDAAAILGDLHPDASASIADSNENEERRTKTPRRNRRRSHSKRYIENDTDADNDAGDEDEQEEAHQDKEEGAAEEEEAKKPASRPSKRGLPTSTRDTTLPTEIIVAADAMDDLELSLSGDEDFYHGPKIPFEQSKVRRKKRSRSLGESKPKGPPGDHNKFKRARNLTSRYASNSNPARISLGKGQRMTYSQVDRLRRASLEAKMAQNEAPSNTSDALSFDESPVQKPSQPIVAVVTTVKKTRATSTEKEVIYARVQEVDFAATPGNQNHDTGVDKATTTKAARPVRRIETLPQRIEKAPVTERDDRTKKAAESTSSTASVDSITEHFPKDDGVIAEDKSSDCVSWREHPVPPATVTAPASLRESEKCKTDQSSNQQREASPSVPPTPKMTEHEATTSAQDEAVPSSSQNKVTADSTTTKGSESSEEEEVPVVPSPTATSVPQVGATITETPTTPNRILVAPSAATATMNATKLQASSPRAPKEVSTPFHSSQSTPTSKLGPPRTPRNTPTKTTWANTQEASTTLHTSSASALSKLQQSSTLSYNSSVIIGANESAPSFTGPILKSPESSKSTPICTMVQKNSATHSPHPSGVAPMLDLAPLQKWPRAPPPEALPTMDQKTGARKTKSPEDAPALETTTPNDSCGTVNGIGSGISKPPESLVPNTEAVKGRKSPKRIMIEPNEGKSAALSPPVVSRPAQPPFPSTTEEGMGGNTKNVPAAKGNMDTGDKTAQLQGEEVQATETQRKVGVTNQRARNKQREVMFSDNASISKASSTIRAKSIHEASAYRTEQTVPNNANMLELVRYLVENADTTTITPNIIISEVEDRLDQELCSFTRIRLKEFINNLLTDMNSSACLKQPTTRNIENQPGAITSARNSLDIFLGEGIDRAHETIVSNFHNNCVTAVSLVADSDSTTSSAQSTVLFSGIASLPNLRDVTISYCGNSLNISQLMKLFTGSSIRRLKLVDVVLSGGDKDYFADTNLHSLRVLHLVGCAPFEESNPTAFQAWLSQLTSFAPLTELWLDSTKGLFAKNIGTFCRTFQRFELGLRCMPVPDNILGYSSLSKLHLIDCAYTCTENALVSSTQAVQRELFVWGKVSQMNAVSFFQKIKLNHCLEILTLTISGGANMNALELDQLFDYNDTLRKVDLVILGGVQNVSQASARVLESLETNTNIISLRIFASKKNSIAQHQQSLRKQFTKTIRANRTLQNIHLFGLEWQRK